MVRHGETEWSAGLRHTGRTDIGLTDAGRAAAAALRPLLAGQEFALVLTSPATRARVFCERAVVTISPANPCNRAARAIEPPIRPKPISAMRLKRGSVLTWPP